MGTSIEQAALEDDYVKNELRIREKEPLEQIVDILR